MIVNEVAPHMSFLIALIATATVVICAVMLGATLWLKRHLAKDLAASNYALTAKIAGLQSKVDTLSAQIPTQTEAELRPTQSPRKIDHAIALAELGASADVIQQETGLPEVDVSAIIRFHTRSEPSFQETLAAQNRLAAFQ